MKLPVKKLLKGALVGSFFSLTSLLSFYENYVDKYGDSFPRFIHDCYAIVYRTFPPEILDSKEIVFPDKTKMTHKNLEDYLGVEILGDYDNKFALMIKNSFDRVKKENPNFLENVKNLVVLPSYIDASYNGLASNSLIVLKNDAQEKTVYHELGHNRSFLFSNEFWDEWERISQGEFRYNLFPNLAYIIPKFTPDNMLGKKEEDFEINNAILTFYGSTNKHENLAVYVGDIFTGSEELKFVPKEEKDNFKTQLNILFKWGFINVNQYDEAVLKLATKRFVPMKNNKVKDIGYIFDSEFLKPQYVSLKLNINS